MMRFCYLVLLVGCAPDPRSYGAPHVPIVITDEDREMANPKREILARTPIDNTPPPRRKGCRDQGEAPCHVAARIKNPPPKASHEGPCRVIDVPKRVTMVASDGTAYEATVMAHHVVCGY